MIEALRNEIKKRASGLYPYNIDQIEFLSKLNEQLSDFDKKLIKFTNEIHPNIFILGLPRSGTTLLSLLIFNSLDIACTNNLIARFWNAPLAGCILSNIIIGGGKSNCYESFYAKTNDIFSPHEFSYFWRLVLKVTDNFNYNPERADETIDWKKLRLIVTNMNAILNNGIIFKTLEYTGYHLKRFHDLFEKSLFIYIKRNETDIAASIAISRLEFYNDLNVWWSSVPLEYQELKNKPYWEQIAGQIYYLSTMYKKIIGDLNSDRIIDISYVELCKNPQEILDEIVFRLKKIFNYKMKQINSPPSRFRISNASIDTIVLERLKEGLRKYGLA